MIVYTCWICEEGVPVTLDVSHHKIPRAYGGQDGPQNEVAVCTRCHDVLHRVAVMLRSPAKASLVPDTLSTVYSNRDSRQRVMELAQLVNKFALHKKENTLEDADSLEEQLQFSLPATYKAKLRVLANETRDATGRRMGMARFVRKMIIDLLDKKFGTR